MVGLSGGGVGGFGAAADSSFEDGRGGDDGDAAEDGEASQELLGRREDVEEQLGPEYGGDRAGCQGNGEDAHVEFAQGPVVEETADDDVDGTDEQEDGKCLGRGEREVSAGEVEEGEEGGGQEEAVEEEVEQVDFAHVAFGDGGVQGVDEGREEYHHGAETEVVAGLEGDDSESDDGDCGADSLHQGEALAQPEEAESEAEEDRHFADHSGDSGVDEGHGLVVESCADGHAHADGEEGGPHATQRIQTQSARYKANEADFDEGDGDYVEGAQCGLDVGKDKAGKYIVQAVYHQQADEEGGAASIAGTVPAL